MKKSILQTAAIIAAMIFCWFAGRNSVRPFNGSSEQINTYQITSNTNQKSKETPSQVELGLKDSGTQGLMYRIGLDFWPRPNAQKFSQNSGSLGVPSFQSTSNDAYMRSRLIRSHAVELSPRRQSGVAVSAVAHINDVCQTADQNQQVQQRAAEQVQSLNSSRRTSGDFQPVSIDLTQGLLSPALSIASSSNPHFPTLSDSNAANPQSALVGEALSSSRSESVSNVVESKKGCSVPAIPAMPGTWLTTSVTQFPSTQSRQQKFNSSPAAFGRKMDLSCNQTLNSVPSTGDGTPTVYQDLDPTLIPLPPMPPSNPK